MCGIIGYIGEKEAQAILLAGLKRLEYRGYDSAGICTLLKNKNKLSLRKLPGKVKVLENLVGRKPLSGSLGIAHSRWATHGLPNQINAHPHLDCDGQVAVVHNGIIENYVQLKQDLVKEGHKFLSQTDTEVIAHLVEKFLKNADLETAVRKTAATLEGSFAIAVISAKEPDKLIGARSGSPLIVGLSKEENFLASDVPAILDFTKEAIFLGENEVAILTKDSVRITDLDGNPVNQKSVKINWDIAQTQKSGFKHFMLKEINEQPEILENILKLRIKDDTVIFEELKIGQDRFSAIDNIVIIACGTAYHAGMVGKYIIEELARLPVNVDLSSEFRYRQPLIEKGTLAIAISQSGETADTLAAVREAKERGAIILAVCNVLGSSLTRESDGVIYTHAGPEIGVASTKAYTAQLAILYLLAFYMASLKQTLTQGKIKDLLEELKSCPGLQKKILGKQDTVKLTARRHSHFGSFLFLGRNVNYPSALEGALKLKEISYIPAEGYAAGEMKHGPIALIDEYRAVVCITTASKVHEKMLSNIQEILSRSGKVISIATEGDSKIKDLTPEVIYIPAVNEIFSPLLVALPLQLLAYHIAVKRGCDVDQPRNLAKSVTVE